MFKKLQVVIDMYYNIHVLSEEVIQKGDFLVELRELNFGNVHQSDGHTNAKGYEGWVRTTDNLLLNQDTGQCKKIVASSKEDLLHKCKMCNGSGFFDEEGSIELGEEYNECKTCNGYGTVSACYTLPEGLKEYIIETGLDELMVFHEKYEENGVIKSRVVSNNLNQIVWKLC